MASSGSPPAPGSSDKTPVLVVTPWYGGHHGGVAVSSASLVGSLQRIGVPVIVLHLGDTYLPRVGRGRAGELTITAGLVPRSAVRRTPKSQLGYWIRRLALDATLRRLRRRHGIRLVHFQYCVESYDEILTTVERVGAPVVATFRGSEVNVHFDHPEIAEVIRRLIRVAARVTTVSAGLLESLARRSPEGAAKAEVIRNAVPLSVWDVASAAGQTNGSEHAPAPVDVLFAGNLLPVKGPDLLLDAFRTVHERRPETRLAFVGSGPMEEELRRKIDAAGLAGAVEFRGRVSREAILAHFRHARVLALPSRNEGMPLAAMEAHMLGVPVVAMNVGGASEVVRDGETGFVVPAGDVGAFADALLALVADEPRRARFGAAAREWALARFNPLGMAQAYAALYDRVAPVKGADGRASGR